MAAPCARSAGGEFTWDDGPLEATVHSFVVARRAFHDAFAERVPYVIVAVDVIPGVRLLGNLLDVGPDEVEIGASVRAAFAADGGSATLVCWRPAGEHPRD